MMSVVRERGEPGNEPWREAGNEGESLRMRGESLGTRVRA